MSRLEQLRQQLEQEKLDALLITNPINRSYMTGFTGTAGVVLITQSKALFITDFRYIEQANQQIQDYEIVEHKGSIQKKVGELVDSLGILSVGFAPSVTPSFKA